MKPILFNTDMVRRLLDGTKTVTRRVVKPQPKNVLLNGELVPHRRYGRCLVIESEDSIEVKHIKPPYLPGDILYVRETWQQGFGGTYLYKADAGHDLFMTPDGEFVSDIPWRPSIHMPREAARIFLRVTGVRVERLQSISPERLRKEGFFLSFTPSECKNVFDRFGAVKNFERKKEEFAALWDNTIKKSDRALYGWDANPWVWVIEFERINKEQAQRKF